MSNRLGLEEISRVQLLQLGSNHALELQYRVQHNTMFMVSRTCQSHFKTHDHAYELVVKNGHRCDDEFVIVSCCSAGGLSGVVVRSSSGCSCHSMSYCVATAIINIDGTDRLDTEVGTTLTAFLAERRSKPLRQRLGSG